MFFEVTHMMFTCEDWNMISHVNYTKFPYFTAKEIINLVMLDGKVVASKRVYKRSKMIADAQDEPSHGKTVYDLQPSSHVKSYTKLHM